MQPKIKKQKQHYVNNDEFLAALIDYRKQVRAAALKENPDITDAELKGWKSPNRPREIISVVVF